MSEVEAIGPTNEGKVWSITIQSVAARHRFVAAGYFFVRSRRAVVAGAPQNRFVLRLHWVPYQAPMATITTELQKSPGLKVMSANFETATLDSRASVGVRHTVRTLVQIVAVECLSPSTLPHVITWRHEGKTGQALVTVRGRPATCLRC